MLTFNLKKEWFEKIACGEKRVEYREVKRYWRERILNEMLRNLTLGYTKTGSHNNSDFKVMFHDPMPCVFVLGYTKKKLPATIFRIEIVDGKDTDLKIDKLVYAIHFELVKEVQK